MSKLKEYPFDKLPIEEMIKVLEKTLFNIDHDAALECKQSGEEKKEVKPIETIRVDKKQVGRQPQCSLQSPPLSLQPPLLSPSNFADVDIASLEHLEVFWAAIKEVGLNTQAPGRMVVISALASTATIVQGLYEVRSPLGFVHPLSLNTISIALSGERKTTVDNYFIKVFRIVLRIINSKIQDLNQNFDSDSDKWKADNQIRVSAYKKARKKGDASEAEADYEAHQKKKPQYFEPLAVIHDDFTVSALLQSLYANMPVASIMTSEGAKMLDDASMKYVPFLNKLWDAADVQVTRIVRDSFWLRSARLSTSLMIQPDVLKKILDKRHDELRSSGYFARALICYPQSNIGLRPVNAVQRYTEKTEALERRLITLMIELLRSLVDPNFKRKELRLDQEAEQMWLDFANYVESQMNPGFMYERATDHASKLPENVLRTAAVLHAGEFGDGKISALTLNAAIKICMSCSKDFVEWFVPLPQDVQDGQKLHKYLHENNGIYLMNRSLSQMYFDERFIRRQRVLQCGPLPNAERLNQALSHLIRERIVAVVEEVRPRGKGAVYIDLIPTGGLPQCSSNGFPLRYVPMN